MNEAGRGLGADVAPVRRFFCKKCRRTHPKWEARCPSCNNHEGLVMTDAPALESPTAASPPAPSLMPAPVPVRAPFVPEEVASSPPAPRPLLSIVRDPVPALGLKDPVEVVNVSAEYVTAKSEEDLVPLSDISETEFVRDSTGLPPLDHVLGGGLVVASVVLLASPPGVGKSSLTLQMLDGLGHRCLYVTGEETREQIAATARRIGVVSKKIYPLVERHLDKIFAKARALRAQTIAIDSIQKMLCEDVSGRAGSASQLKECTARLVQYAKTTGTALWLIGHVTGDGDIAGPRTIEHDVDVVIELEQGAKFEGNERILRCSGKNRFGPANAKGYFELTARGFIAVDGDGWDEEL